MSRSIEQRNYLATMIGFNTKHILDSREVARLTGGMLDDTFLNTLPKLFKDYEDYINGLHIYPFDLRPFASSLTLDNIRAGGKEVKYNGTNVQGYSLQPMIELKSAGTFTISRQFNNFLDFEPFTTIDIFLPFCGWIRLNNDIVYKCSQLEVKYAINFDTGSCNAYVVGTINNTETLLYTQEGQCGFNLPIGSTNATDVTKNIISGAIQTITSATAFAFNSPIAGFRQLGNAINTFMNTKHTASYGAQSRGVESDVTPLNVIVRIERPIIAGSTQSQYKSYKGIPDKQIHTLSTLSGFTKVQDIHLEGITNATQDEIDTIESLLKDGVLL